METAFKNGETQMIQKLLRRFSSGYLATLSDVLSELESARLPMRMLFTLSSVRHGLVVHRLRSSDPIFGYFSLGTANILLDYAQAYPNGSLSKPPEKASFQRRVKEAIMTVFPFPFTIGTFPLFPSVNNIQ